VDDVRQANHPEKEKGQDAEEEKGEEIERRPQETCALGREIPRENQGRNDRFGQQEIERKADDKERDEPEGVHEPEYLSPVPSVDKGRVHDYLAVAAPLTTTLSAACEEYRRP
jgi:hypothetical protein